MSYFILFYPVDEECELDLHNTQFVYNADVIKNNTGYKLLGIEKNLEPGEVTINETPSWMTRNWGTLNIMPPQYWMLEYNM